MNRNVATRTVSAPPRPARVTALRSARPQPRRKGVLGRIVRWLVVLGLLGAIIASFFVQADPDHTYADLHTLPAYRWAKDKIFPPETESGTAKKDAVPAGPSELDTRFEQAAADRAKAEGAKTPEAADEAVAFLEKELDAAGRRIDAVREVGLEASKPAPRKTRIGTAQAVEELAAQARTQKEIAAGLVKHKSSQAAKAAVAAVPLPPPPPPPVVPYDLRKLHAWPSRPAGTWVRWKKTLGETESYEDHVLATLTDEAAVVRIEEVPGNLATGERLFLFGADRARVVREESLKVGDAELPCRVVQSGSTLRWIPKEGPGADRVAVKVQAGDQTIVVTELGEEEVPVKGETKKCLKVTTGESTVWSHDDVPGFAVRVKTGSETAEAIEWGADPTLRPATRKKAPPVPVAEVLTTVKERPVKRLVADAEQLTNEGASLLREVMEAMKDPPSESERLQALLTKTGVATTLLGDAWERFLWAKEKALDPSIDEKLSKLSRALEIAAEYSVSIKSRLK